MTMAIVIPESENSNLSESGH